VALKTESRGQIETLKIHTSVKNEWEINVHLRNLASKTE
jgi:hypothetical protein